ncbi:hypothetical protein BDF22DRAFT_665550 [Syncephalis plumigaleata]|nr:hypothetical protein BDF22DRAFT_665550 [Syncephalis plumigaleata]
MFDISRVSTNSKCQYQPIPDGNDDIPAIEPSALLEQADATKQSCRTGKRGRCRAIRCLFFIASFLGLIYLMYAFHSYRHPRNHPMDDDDAVVATTSGVATKQAPPVEYELQRRILNTNYVPFVMFPDRLQQTLNVTYVHQLLADVNRDRRLVETLHPMESAFVRVITPAEFAILHRQGVTMDQINDAALNRYIAYTEYQIDCLAVTEASDDFALYLRVYSRQWLLIRGDIAEIFYGLGGDKSLFQPERYHPHITVGHSHPGKLHDDKVAINDDNHSCWANIRLVGPEY